VGHDDMDVVVGFVSSHTMSPKCRLPGQCGWAGVEQG
jgi:hypothetical protein